jgi:hypothetical protein
MDVVYDNDYNRIKKFYALVNEYPDSIGARGSHNAIEIDHDTFLSWFNEEINRVKQNLASWDDDTDFSNPEKYANDGIEITAKVVETTDGAKDILFSIYGSLNRPERIHSIWRKYDSDAEQEFDENPSSPAWKAKLSGNPFYKDIADTVEAVLKEQKKARENG